MQLYKNGQLFNVALTLKSCPTTAYTFFPLSVEVVTKTNRMYGTTIANSKYEENLLQCKIISLFSDQEGYCNEPGDKSAESLCI